ncbi:MULTISPECIES: HslU--HslV peptidase ATPase subunit [Virgibacillus]|uniref:ATP-dependent protease ATPase subunit HslU n=2 Tax=Virgibacillus TaxID=84406 RepID=A0A024QC62_9BACI|nr:MULTISPECIES: HslU--HslV peptidase ATPase subunit [Virgibacillus]EQB36425.1 ATP-dependent protease [Virgibacillus sp. CM-4]MYL42258.1 HslU--HslV peptidase ATPase subunit [Virgibacillus massiliensis]GGJ43994.1 ATP-dependent protease ATPase subunit ClpY [Virgibacillus kapii]CDQ40123.1 ATP-dependent protease ATPase subunit ClpY [Virgibacillus massiliensis]
MGIDYTPKQIVGQLDKYIIGQNSAKRSVAVALRNRYRRMQLEESLKDEIVPKNILMIGPTGVGKTEIARRLAKLVGAPFVKVEATKFTEVGYVGRDVESMVRDLVEMALRMVKEEKMKEVMGKAEKEANKKLVKLLVPQAKKDNNARNPFEMLFPSQSNDESDEENEPKEEEIRNKRQRTEHQLALGELEDHIVTIEIEEQSPSMFDMLQGSGMEQMGMNMQDAFSQFMPKKKKKRKLPVSEARKVLTQQEASKLVDMEEAAQEAIQRAEQSGILFIDEIDKVAGKQENSANVSREGVQRDILPIIEGSTVVTKHGAVKTDHMLFIAAGAFHMSKPSDLIPELQGRFPIRVELDKLSTEDFKRILKEPSNALIKQYKALLKTEGINVTFTDDAVDRLAEIAYEVNQEMDNIGARRLHTILEKLLEDLSFEAPEVNMDTIDITPAYVDEKLSTIAKNKDLSQYIL